MRQNTIRYAALFLAAVMMMGLFSGCKTKPLSGEPYTFTVQTDADGERKWNVKTDSSGVVSYAVTEQADGETAIVFTGLRRGDVKATLYRAAPGKTERAADDVYVLLLRVDRKGNVSETDRRYGAYTVNCGQGITGSDWRVECPDGGVHWTETQKPIRRDGDGMQGYDTLYTFTGSRPGASHVLVQTYLPWCDVLEPMRDLWLYVDSEYRVSSLEMTDFQSFRLVRRGMRVEANVYEAEKTDGGVRLSSFEERSRWSDEENDYVAQRFHETTVDGDETLYRSLAGLLHECGVQKWDGFNGSDPRVLDGTTFTFEAVLSDGTKIYAAGSNSFPDGYHSMTDMLYTLIERTQETAS